MKFKFVYTFFAVVCAAIIFMGSSGGRASSANSGNTGAPGDAGATCITCHGTNANITVDLAIAITDDDGNAIDKYVPGTVYNGSVSLAASMGTPSAWGFQVVALRGALNENGESVNTFSDPTSNVQITTITSGRQYAEHNGPSATGDFNFKWTAPEEASGPVTFYSCGNGVNLNGGTSGDNAACSTLELQERPVSVADLAREAKLTVFPNPVAAQINLSVNSRLTGPYTARLLDVAGREWLRQPVTLTGGEDRFRFAAEGVPAGIYFLQLSNGSLATTLRVVKR